MPSSLPQDELEKALSKVLLQNNQEDVEGLDEDLVSYLAGLLSDGLEEEITPESVSELMDPFLESIHCPPQLVQQANETVLNIMSDSTTNNNNTHAEVKKLKQGLVSMSSNLTSQTDAEVEANRFAWGTDTIMTNKTIDAFVDKSSSKDRRKAKQELEQARREYQAQLESAQQQDNGVGVVSNMVLPDYGSGRNERDVQVRNVSISLDSGRSLLDNGELKFAHQRRYGLVGKNGVGKTTLLKAIAAMEIEGFPRHLRVLHVRQELKMTADDTPVLQAVLQADAERNALLEQEQALLKELEQADGADGNSTTTIQEKRVKLLETKSDTAFQTQLKQLDQVYARLQVLAADAAESRAATILSGLQFTPDMQAGPTSALSGGWRMRVALAAALFIEPDILMLDEPTNHLDLEAVLWLESYLVEYKHTLIVVSHDRGFLNEVCTDIIEFHKQKLTYYRGNYDTYVKAKDENVKNAMRVYHAYQDKRAHMMEFIEKFRANAKRATMVQSRIKAVEKMDLEAPEPIEVEPVWRFSIPNPEPLGRPIISVDDVTFDYKTVLDNGEKKPESEYLLQMVNFGVDLDSRIGILGANGAGKSTLLNLILGIIEPIKGSVSRNGRLRIGHFTQHSADKFDLQLSSVENMMQLFPGVGDQEMRSFVGRFQIQGTEALKPMFLLSGGQKSRVAFASLAYQKPHVIIMDEPTNHLDMESIDALVEAIKSFRGGLMVVSHDQYFITNTCSELWVVGDGKATRFRGDFDDYKAHTLERTRKRVEASVKRLGAINN